MFLELTIKYAGRFRTEGEESTCKPTEPETDVTKDLLVIRFPGESKDISDEFI